MVPCSLQELLGSPQALVAELVGQVLTGGPGKDHPNDVGVDDSGQHVALLGEAPDVLVESLPLVLPAVLQVLRVPRALVHVLEVSHEDLLEVL